MKTIKRKIVLIGAISAIFTSAIFAAPRILSYFKLKVAVEAAGALPYQIGLTQVVIIPCFTTGIPPICEGGTLCYVKDAATCTLYSDVSGALAGGMGYNALFLKTAIAQAGLTPGGQLIAGGTSPVLMDNGVLASSGGCYGCAAALSENKKYAFLNKVLDMIDKFIQRLIKISPTSAKVKNGPK